MRILVALGGNALLRRGEALTAENQRKNVRIAAEALAPLGREHELVISHGNGPRPMSRWRPIRWTCWAPRRRG
jgi:carbamate kinase